MDVILDEESDIGVPAEKPEELSDDSLPVDFFGREEWKTLSKVKPELTSKKTIRHISTSEILVVDTVLDEVSPEVEVLLFWMDLSHRKYMKRYKKFATMSMHYAYALMYELYAR
jgi:hypothetical protein